MTTVAIEQSYPEAQRLVQDALASSFLPPAAQPLVKFMSWPPARRWMFNLSEKRAPGVWGSVLCRKRYVDDKLNAALKEGVQAVVVLGAGLDTHAYRMSSPIPVFEVELPENTAYKKTRLQKLYGGIPAHVTLTSADFNTQDLGSALAAQGYPIGQKSFFIWEAVTQYLTEGGVRNVLSFLAQTQAGSQCVFTYIRRDFIEGTTLYGHEVLYQIYRIKRALWHFGLAPEHVGDFLAEYGWQELEQMGPQEYTARYLQPIGRALPVTEIERAVHAEKR
jgi:methyltransferase (TIGR00027 family)